jgi:hypothetical protein
MYGDQELMVYLTAAILAAVFAILVIGASIREVIKRRNKR